MEKKAFEEYNHMEQGIAELNTSRGGSPNRLKGFIAEQMNTADSNVDRIQEGVAARECVIDDNGPADAIVKYKNGQLGRPIQDKCGYDYYYYKKILSEGTYDGMILRINGDNPVFENEQQLKVLSELAREHGVKIERAKVTKAKVEKIAELASKEGKIRTAFGMKNTAPVTAKMVSTQKKMEYAVSDANRFVSEQVSKFLPEDVAEINRAGLDSAMKTAAFAAALSVSQNLFRVVEGDKAFDEAAKEILIDTSSSAVIAYATGAASKALGFENQSDAAILVTGTVQISRQVFSYVSGDIDERQLLDNVSQTAAYLAATYIGKTIGGTIGSAAGPLGTVVGQYVGELITSAVCSEVISIIQQEKAAKKYNQKMLALAHHAESEIRLSQERVQLLINDKNREFLNKISAGYDRLVNGIALNDMDMASAGIIAIGEQFDISEEVLRRGHVTQGHIFDHKSRVIEIS